MSGRTDWIRAIEHTENATARALDAQRAAVELRLALRGAERRGRQFEPENVPVALKAMPVIEAALAAYCELLRAERGARRRNKDVSHG